MTYGVLFANVFHTVSLWFLLLTHNKPKVEDPSSFKDFRPISLCNALYKLVTKVLVNRLRSFLNDMISPLQSSFIPGWGTTNNVILLQEIVHHMHKSKRRKDDLVLKLDLKKAYDWVDWDFLRNTLQLFGFPSGYHFPGHAWHIIYFHLPFMEWECHA